MDYYVYVLKSVNYSKSYVGISKNPEKRLNLHNKGNYFYTKRYRPWEIIYVEKYQSMRLARKREKYFKSSSGRNFLKNLF